MQVNRYLKNKDMDHIDHALGRPVDPINGGHRNYFYSMVEGDERFPPPYWQDRGKGYYSVTHEGREALSDHLREISDKHRLYIVSYKDTDMTPIAATSRSRARYRKWLDVSDLDDGLTFAHFLRKSKVRLA